MKYSEFTVIKLEETGPQVWNFETLEEVTEFLLGKFVPYYAVFNKHRELIRLRSTDTRVIERQWK